MVRASFPDQSWLADVGPIPGIDAVVWNLTDPPPTDDIEVVIPNYLGAARRIGAVANVPTVRFVQLLTAGYDGILEKLPEGVAVANAGHLHDDSTSEMALALTLAGLRGIPQFVRNQADGTWARPHDWPALADRRVLVLGYGSVGRAIVSRLLPFKAEVTAVASRARPGDDLVDRVHGTDELPTLLPLAQVVIVVVPLSDATRGLVGDDFLAALPDGALVVNVARGPVADTEAVLRQTDRLAFALDVTDPEPLPAEHPLWRAPNVLISPHVGGMSTAMRPRAIQLLREQLGRIGRGEEPSHLVRGEFKRGQFSAIN